MKIEIPQNAKQILEVLMKQGYEAYVVGGCVRDFLLQKEPMDWDITTSATPYQVKELFKKTVDTGIQHGTVTVLIHQTSYEVTTYRLDGEYEDHRRPKEVIFTSNLVEDLKRRDFTMNAMAYNDRDGLIDCFGGISDLRSGVIRCVGKAEERFEEDALRMLRAIRFSAQLGFEIEEETKYAILHRYQLLKEISAERIQVELTKLLTSKFPEKLVTAYKLGVTSVILPEFDKMMETSQHNPYHDKTVGFHAIESVRQIEATKVLRWTMLLHDIGKPDTKTTENETDHFYQHAIRGSVVAKEILERFKMDNATIHKVIHLIKWHDYMWNKSIDKRIVRKAASKIGMDFFLDFLKVQRADVLAQSKYKQKEKLEVLDKIEEAYQEIQQEGECLSLKQLKINGRQLQQLGVKQGIGMGKLLRYLLQRVIEEPSLNEYEKLVQIVGEKLDDYN